MFALSLIQSFAYTAVHTTLVCVDMSVNARMHARSSCDTHELICAWLCKFLLLSWLCMSVHTYMDPSVHGSCAHPATDVFMDLSVQLLLIWIALLSGFAGGGKAPSMQCHQATCQR